MTRRLCGWLVVAAFALVLATRAAAQEGAGSETVGGAEADRATPVTLDIPIFAGGYGTAFYEETARLFEAQRPEVGVRLYGDPRIADKVRVRVIDGHPPDATLTGAVLWPALIRAGRVVDLTPYLDGPNWEGDARWADTFHPGALDAWRIDGRIYGLPFGYAVWSIFYDRALFRAHGWTEPRTWDEFFALCEQIRAAGLAPLALTGTRGLYPEAFQRAAYYNLAGPAGWRALEELAPGARTDPRFVRSAAVLQRLTRDYTLRGWEGATHTGAQLAFLDGRAAMTVSGSWFINEMKPRLPAGFELGTMNFPVFAADDPALAAGPTSATPGGDPTAIQTGSDCFFVFATGDAERERLVVDFLRFLTSRSRAEAWVRQMDAPVAVRGVPEEAYSPLARPTAALIAAARASYNMPQDMLQSPAIRQTLTDARFRLMTGALTPQEFGEQLEAAAARDRGRAADPDLVEVRHPWRAAALLGGLAAVLFAATWRVVAQRTRRRAAAAEAGAVAEGATRAMRPATALGFVGPALAVYATFVLAPAVAALGWAFTRWDGLGERRWAGWFQFRWLLLESDAFWTALGNNLFLVVVPAAVVIPVALLCATLLHRGMWGAGALRVVFLFPNMLGGIAATLIWLGAYEPHGGLVNATLVAAGDALARIGGPDAAVAWLRGFDGFAWLAPDVLYPALVPIYLWMACGFNLVLYLAAMQGVPVELYEAARLDGASAWRQFHTITLPLIWDVLAISAVFLVIGGLNAFELVWLLTAQDPVTSVHTLGTLMVATMFKDFDVGRATAIAVLLFVLVLAATALVRRGLEREVVER